MEPAIKFIKFCMVGATGMVLDFSVTYVLKEKIGVHRYLANTCGFISATVLNYFLNRVWTFQSLQPDLIQQYSMFLLLAVIGLGLNTLFLIFFERRGLSFYIAKLLAITLTTLWNFITNYFFTFASG